MALPLDLDLDYQWKLEPGLDQFGMAGFGFAERHGGITKREG